jgi:hypothetical protein
MFSILFLNQVFQWIFQNFVIVHRSQKFNKISNKTKGIDLSKEITIGVSSKWGLILLIKHMIAHETSMTKYRAQLTYWSYNLLDLYHHENHTLV